VLIALLHTIRHEPKIDLRHYGMSQSQLVDRGEEIATGNCAPEAMTAASMEASRLDP
jgi:hypothetical protein